MIIQSHNKHAILFICTLNSLLIRLLFLASRAINTEIYFLLVTNQHPKHTFYEISNIIVITVYDNS